MAVPGPNLLLGSAGKNQRVERRAVVCRPRQSLGQVDSQAFAAQPDGDLGWDIEKSGILRPADTSRRFRRSWPTTTT